LFLSSHRESAWAVASKACIEGLLIGCIKGWLVGLLLPRLSFQRKTHADYSFRKGYDISSLMASRRVLLWILMACLASHLQSVAVNGRREIVYLGKAAVDRLLSRAKFQVAPITDPNVWSSWIKTVVSRRIVTDREFLEKVQTRDLRRKHAEQLSIVEARATEAQLAYELCPNYPVLKELDDLIRGGTQAIASMEKYVLTTPFPAGVYLQEKIDKVAQGLPSKKVEVAQALAMREALRLETIEYANLEQAIAAKNDVYTSIGLFAAMERVAKSSKDGGGGRNKRGKSFEDTSAEVLQKNLVPLLAARHGVREEDVLVVRNIKLGMASLKGSTSELDSLIIIKSPRPQRLSFLKAKSSFALVLCVVEMKRNADDLGEAFCNLQSSLNWLAGRRDAYDAQQWVTKAYPNGHFDSTPFLQECNGEQLLFSPESFAHLNVTRVERKVIPTFTDGVGEKEEGKGKGKEFIDLFVDNVFFVCKDGCLENVPSKALSWCMSKLASEEEHGPGEAVDESALEALRLRTSERYPHKFSTSDLLALHQETGVVENIIVVGEQ